MQETADWILAQGERDGFPMLVRMSTEFAGTAPVPGYDHHLIVSVRLRHPQANGFPGEDEGDALKSLEMRLSSLLEADRESLCVLVITNNGLRDFIFYTRDAGGVQKKIENRRAVFGGFKAELALERDPDWQIYLTFKQWLNRGRAGEESRLPM